jgi:hypothetical protein
MEHPMKSTNNPFEYVPLAGYTIQEWCHRGRISQPQYFKIQNEGTGPRVTRIGRRVIITTEADE